MITKRTAERLMRAAYDFGDLAMRLKAEGYAMEGNSIEEVASILHKIGGKLDSALDRKRQEGQR